MALYQTKLNVKASPSIKKWVAALAKDADRTPSAFIRDLIFLLRFSNAGPVLCRHIQDEGIRYHSDEVQKEKLTVRVDPNIQKWLAELATQAGQSSGSFLKSVIYYMRLSPGGLFLVQRLVDQNVHYRPFRGPVIPPAMVRPVFPWDHNLPEQSKG